VQKISDGNDLDSIEEAIKKAQQMKSKPSLVIVRTHIGYASPKQDTAAAHGEPLGEDGVMETKKKLGWPIDKKFYVPPEVVPHFKAAVTRGEGYSKKWNNDLKEYRNEHPDLGREFSMISRGELPRDWDKDLLKFNPQEGPIATRSASGLVMNHLSKKLPHTLIGGSADLAPSTKTLLIGYGDFGFGSYCSNNLHFGVREHAMGAIVNGMALFGGIIPYGATFLIFSDYMRPSIRIAALMNIPSIFIFTHDSI
jgi:transketolase